MGLLRFRCHEQRVWSKNLDKDIVMYVIGDWITSVSLTEFPFRETVKLVSREM